MYIPFVPKTRLGKWSIWLIIVFILSFIVFQLLVASGQRGGATFFSNPILSVPILIAGIAGVSGFFAGIIGVLRSKERSVLVFIATVIGFLILVFVSMEFLSSH